MPLRILRAARAGRREPRPGLPRHGDVLDLLPRHALPGARPSLQRARDRRGVPALDAHRRRARRRASPHGWCTGSGRCRCSPAAWRAPLAGLLLFATRRAGHRLLPDDLPRLLRDRPRHRHRLHAAADARHGRRSRRGRRARLRDHEPRPSRSAGRSALAVLSTDRREPHAGTAGRRPRADQRADRRLPGSRSSAGAAAIGAGIVLAFALLRRDRHQPELRLAGAPGGDDTRASTTLDLEDQAA